MPSVEHEAASGTIFSALADYSGHPTSGRRGGWWISMDVDLFLAGQGLRPDLVGWRIDRNPQAPGKLDVETHLGVYMTPPDWVCEVLSGSTSYRDVRGGVKWEAWHEAGVGHYWTVDLANEVLMVFELGARRYELATVVGRDDARTLPPFDSVEFAPRRMFEIVAAMTGR